ncbi:hypothetical protein JOD82_003404 [Paenibacillus sp. 1182]|nr:hypothetical protein [Paenibacillus sp. 1182]
MFEFRYAILEILTKWSNEEYPAGWASSNE